MIEPAQQQRAILHAQQIEGRCEDAIIEIGAITEAELLQYLANIFRTRFVTTPKLAKLSVAPAVLRLVPKKLAEKLTIFPILYDADKGALSVVAADPVADDIVKQVQMVSKVKNVLVYIARPATIEALVKKHYDGHRTAFAELAARFPSVGRSLGVGQQNYGGVDYYQNTGASAPDPMTDPSMGTGERPLAPAARRRKSAPPIDLGPADTAQPVMPARRQRAQLTIEAPDVAAAPPSSAAQSPVEIPSAPVTTPKAEPEPAVVRGVSYAEYLDTLNVLVALLEQSRNELRGHSAQVARLCKRLAERMGLNDEDSFGLTVAAQIHDIGKGASYHLTPLNVAQYEGHRIQAQKTHQAPLRFFESVKLVEATTAALDHLYERPDGKGFPDRLSGKDVPMPARILAIVETYCDLDVPREEPVPQDPRAQGGGRGSRAPSRQVLRREHHRHPQERRPR